MDRELVLAVLGLLVVGPLTLVSGWWRLPLPVLEGARHLERKLWLRLWAPLVPAIMAIGVILGWALLEPEDAEALPSIMFRAAAPFALIVGRALIRALRAAFQHPGDVPAAAVGLVRPRIVFSRQLEAALDPDALHAAHAHEQAHVRHRDPLRIWLAQLTTDFQWPSPAAPERFRKWHQALELARDEEARAAGVAGDDLAAAIITAARMSISAPLRPFAGITGDAAALQDRIARLLGPVAGGPAAPASRWHALLGAGLAVAIVVGAALGETVVRALVVRGP